jgi:hypothetical protein
VCTLALTQLMAVGHLFFGVPNVFLDIRAAVISGDEAGAENGEYPVSEKCADGELEGNTVAFLGSIQRRFFKW